MITKYSRMFHGPETGGGSPPAASPAGGAPTAAGGSPGRATETGAGLGSQPGSAADASAWKAPEFLPDHLRDADVAKTFEKVAADWKTLRDKVAQTPSAAKTVDEYTFTPSDKVKPFLGADLAKDPVFGHAREAALKAGLPAAAFEQFVSNFYEGMVDAKAIPAPYNPAAERDALLGDRAYTMTEAQKVEAVRPVLAPLVGYLERLKTAGDLSPGSYAALGGLLNTADGVRAVAKLVDLASRTNPGLAAGGSSSAQQASPQSLKARQGDPRNTPGSHAYDPKFREETLRQYQQVYG